MQDYYTPKGKHLTLADRRKKRKPIGSLSMLAFHHPTTVDKEPCFVILYNNMLLQESQ